MKTKRMISLVLCGAMLASSCFVVAASESKEQIQNNTKDISIAVTQEKNTYDDYLSKFSDFTYGQTDIHIDCEEASLNTIGQKISYTFTVNEDGLYNINLTYMPLEGTDLNPAIAVKIDGEYPFEGLENTELSRWFTNDGEGWSKDGQGNEFSPEQIEVQSWYTQTLFDEDGIETEPYQIALTKGEHTVEIESLQEPVAISKIKFGSPENSADYEMVKKEYKDAKAYDGKDIVIQGEDAVLKSTSSLTAKSDNISANVTPQSPYKSRINYIGGTNWSQADEVLTWEFDVKESGLYSLHFHYKQSGVVNGRVFRYISMVLLP